MFLVCGEALFDFFLETEEGPAAATYAARAGGSPFNVAVGVARLGAASGLLTGLSDDLLGAKLARVLEAEGVSTRYAVPSHLPTTISLVGLDPEGVPAYQFYGNGAADTSLEVSDLPAIGPEVTGLHFGSYSLAVTPVADAFARLAEAEAEGARFISLDPNVRASIEPDLDLWRARIAHLLPLSALVKISTEDLHLLHPGTTPEAFAAETLSAGARLVVVTDGGGPALGWTASGLHARAVPPRISVVDTVGAGDTFQAALIARLSRAAGGPAEGLAALDRPGLEGLLDYAARAAAFTCARRGADLPRAGDVAD